MLRLVHPPGSGGQGTDPPGRRKCSRAPALSLTDGNSIRGTARMIGVGKNGVMDFGLRVGEGCARLHNRLVRRCAAHIVQCDETWSFIRRKQARCDPDKDPAEWGDAYTFIALDATSKLVISYLVGNRDQPSADAFITDLRARLTVVPHLTTDGFIPYVAAVGAAFPGSIDYGQVQKNYRTGAARGPDHRYEPPRDPFITKTTIFGAPDEHLLSTSYVERYNLTSRHIDGRTRRLCLAFSKTKRGHEAAMALAVFAYNFVRVHSALGTTPAVAAGIATRPWTIGELVDAALAEEPSEAPVPVPLAMPSERAGKATGAARQLANGGWLRAVPSDGGAPPAAPRAPTPPAGSAPAPAPDVAPPVDDRQLDLLTWRPRARPLPPPGSQVCAGHRAVASAARRSVNAACAASSPCGSTMTVNGPTSNVRRLPPFDVTQNAWILGPTVTDPGASSMS